MIFFPTIQKHVCLSTDVATALKQASVTPFTDLMECHTLAAAIAMHSQQRSRRSLENVSPFTLTTDARPVFPEISPSLAVGARASVFALKVQFLDHLLSNVVVMTGSSIRPHAIVPCAPPPRLRKPAECHAGGVIEVFV